MKPSLSKTHYFCDFQWMIGTAESEIVAKGTILFQIYVYDIIFAFTNQYSTLLRNISLGIIKHLIFEVATWFVFVKK